MSGEKDTTPVIVVIAGPTASGKTALGIEMSLLFNGEVINADSMQVYKKMDIGTAKPTLEERKGIAHHMLDVVEPDEEFNAALFASMADPVIKDINRRGKVCFLVGGTGFYIRALLNGIMPYPGADPAFRDYMRKQFLEKGSKRFYSDLERLDPEYAAKIHPNDTFRIMRALEIIHLTGSSPSTLAREHAHTTPSYRVLKIFIDLERESLYRRINQRSEHMLRAGLVEETESLLRQGYSPGLKSMQSIGYRHVVNYLDGIWTWEETLEYLKRDTRRYAKRQITWFKADHEFLWIRPDSLADAVKTIREFLGER